METTTARVAMSPLPRNPAELTLPTAPDLIRALWGQVAQSVEQRTENPRVGSSILPLATTYLTVPVPVRRSSRAPRQAVLRPLELQIQLKYAEHDPRLMQEGVLIRIGE